VSFPLALLFVTVIILLLLPGNVRERNIDAGKGLGWTTYGGLETTIEETTTEIETTIVTEIVFGLAVTRTETGVIAVVTEIAVINVAVSVTNDITLRGYCQ